MPRTTPPVVISRTNLDHEMARGEASDGTSATQCHMAGAVNSAMRDRPRRTRRGFDHRKGAGEARAEVVYR